MLCKTVFITAVFEFAGHVPMFGKCDLGGKQSAPPDCGVLERMLGCFGATSLKVPLQFHFFARLISN